MIDNIIGLCHIPVLLHFIMIFDLVHRLTERATRVTKKSRKGISFGRPTESTLMTITPMLIGSVLSWE